MNKRARSPAVPIIVKNARANNLKGVNLTFEPGRLYALVGPSGSGKTSLAFDVLYAEANRQGTAWGLVRVYRPPHPAARVSGLPERTIGIQQQVLHRFTTESVGRYTGFLDRVLASRLGRPKAPTCDHCHGRGYVRDIDESRLIRDPKKPLTQGALTPVVKALAQLDSRKWQRYAKDHGFRPDAAWGTLPPDVRQAVLNGRDGFVSIVDSMREALSGHVPRLPKNLREDLEQELQSSTSRVLCRDCGGLGYAGLGSNTAFDKDLGSLVEQHVLPMSATEQGWLQRLALNQINLLSPVHRLSSYQARALRLMAGVCSLERPALVLFDEPVAGLLPREAVVMAGVLRELADAGHTVIAAEHGQELVRASDTVVAFGPGAGELGGHVVFQGPPSAYFAKYPAGAVWNGKNAMRPTTTNARARLQSSKGESLRISSRAIRHRTLRASSKSQPLRISFSDWSGMANVDVAIPLGRIVCVSGPAGSGKTAILEAVFAAADKSSCAWLGRVNMVSRHGHESIRRPHIITPEGIGTHPGSTPATYIGVWDHFRDLYASLPDARRLRLTRSHFSFNAPEGRCPTCLGKGFQEWDDGSYAHCPTCEGGRLCARAAHAKWKGVSLPQINSYTVHQASELFSDKASIVRYLGFLDSVALDYLVLGQPSWSLSGGEAQRVKIATELCKRLGDRSLYILDEPFRGVGQQACPHLFHSLRHLVNKNNTVLIAENDPAIACRADWLIMLESPKRRLGGGASLNIVWQGEGRDCPETFWDPKPADTKVASIGLKKTKKSKIASRTTSAPIR